MTSSSRPGALSFGLSALIVYLALNAVSGRQGLISYVHIQQREHALLAERDELAAESADLRTRIRALADSTLDLDALEEQARRQIGAAAPGEIVFDLAQNTTQNATAGTP